VIAERTPAGWPMFFGDPSRTGLMPDVADIDWARPLGNAWEYQPNFTLKSAAPQQQGGRTATTIMNGRMVQILIDDNGRVLRSQQEVAGLPDLSRADLTARWRDANWQPVGELLFADGRVLLKAEDRIVCCTADTGAVQWMGRKTRYPLDGEMQQSAAFAAAGMVVTEDGSDKRPRTLTETVLFGDRVAQSMTVAGDIVLNVEGELDYLKKPPSKQQDPNQALQLMMMRGQVADGAGMTGQNWLAAYELRTGKLRWHRGAGDGEAASGRFLCAPLPVGESLITAVGDDTRIIAAGLDRETGATQWRVTLCDTPGEGRVSQAPVGLAAGEGDLYVATGSGTVFALDALSGSVKWAAAYPRRLPKYVGQAQVLMRAMQGGESSTAPTYSRAEFRDNIVLRHGDQVIVLASDFDYAIALDVQSGTLRWEAPLAPTGSGAAAQYCLGVLEGRLYLGGPSVLRAYDVRGGRLEWERPLEKSSGRGLLTRGGLYVPEKDRIQFLDPRTGVVINSTSVVAPDGAPVGNLYSDSGRLFAVGAARVSALGAAAKPEQEATP
jgi:outer membrane protein assembly factor BamB